MQLSGPGDAPAQGGAGFAARLNQVLAGDHGPLQTGVIILQSFLQKIPVSGIIGCVQLALRIGPGKQNQVLRANAFPEKLTGLLLFGKGGGQHVGPHVQKHHVFHISQGAGVGGKP